MAVSSPESKLHHIVVLYDDTPNAARDVSYVAVKDCFSQQQTEHTSTELKVQSEYLDRVVSQVMAKVTKFLSHLEVQ